MTKLTIKITEQAEQDIKEIKKYIEKDNQTAAKALFIKIKNAFITLSEYPNLGINRPELADDKNIFFYVVHCHYLIVYQIMDDTLNIVRILTSYQNICDIL